MDDLSGKYLGRYHLLEPLGEGGMATVYKAYDTRLEREVAVKIIRSSAFSLEVFGEVLKRFEREAKSLARLSHPNIVKVYDFGEHESSPYLVMEYLPGGTLKKFLGKPVAWQSAIRFLLPIARGITYAHQRGILHRDIKPANILITENNEPMLSDFGIAKLFDGELATALTGSGMAIGTPEYMAPEQWTGRTSPQSDLYSFSIVLYELLAGRKPYIADTPAAIMLKQATEPLPRPSLFTPELPESVEFLLLKALAKDPLNRFTDMNVMVEALDNLFVSTSTLPALATMESKQEASDALKAAQVLTEIRGGDTTVLPAPNTASRPRPPQKRFDWFSSIFQKTAIASLGVGLLILGLSIAFSLVGRKLYATSFSPTAVSTLPTSSLVQSPVATLISPPPLVTTQPTISAPTIIKTSLPAITTTSTIAPGSIQVSSRDGMFIHYIPAGIFIMGDSAEHAFAECEKTQLQLECNKDDFTDQEPTHQVYLDAFWMDETEVTNAMYKLCVDAGVCKKPETLDYYPYRQFANHPVVFINWSAANIYCQWVQRRLPTEAEWEKAARGTDGSTYPWGDIPGKEYANYNLYVGDTVEVGRYEAGKSPYGLYDMAGNVYEWTADWYQANYYKTLGDNPFNPQGPTVGENHVIKGGGFIYNFIQAADRDASFRASNATGFRCAMDVNK